MVALAAAPLEHERRAVAEGDGCSAKAKKESGSFLQKRTKNFCLLRP
jgi:hypothetical protein